MIREFGASLAKDLLLLARDRAGVVFLTIAPIVVITVAGFSLASLYGANPRGTGAYVLPFVDEDGGEVASALRERLAKESAVVVEPVETRDEARHRLRSREAGAALIVPRGTTRAIEEGRPASLVLYTDPVKYLEIANVRVLVQELRHGLESESRRRSAERFRTALTDARTARAKFADEERSFRNEAARRRKELEKRLAEVRSRMEEARRNAAAELQAAANERRSEIRQRLERELSPLRDFLETLRRKKAALESWLADVREQAGSYAEKLPSPPSLPEIPREAERLAVEGPDALAERLLAAPTPSLDLPEISFPRLPELPDLSVPDLPEPTAASFPGSLDLQEESVTGAPRRLNTFDQNVPGFSITFLLLGLLLGVSLGLLDERDWGTFERLRASAALFPVVLLGKLVSRFLVGFAQMILLFAIGWAAFGVSLGPEPWALLLPIGGIVFAGTAFGLVIAGVATSREAVLPVGSIVIVTMAAVGGCWWPIDLEPPWMRTVALAFPTTWAMAAFNDLMIRRQALEAAVRPAVVLVAYGMLYLAIGLALFRRHMRPRSRA